MLKSDLDLSLEASELLETLWDTEHCMSGHGDPENGPCQHQVAGFTGCRSCPGYIPSCVEQIAYFQRVMLLKGDFDICAGCGRTIGSVWHVVIR
jgi:hypothetical protein